MKKYFFILFPLILFPVFVLPVSEKGIELSRITKAAVPFNERFDPVTDSPYNAFDNNYKTAAIYSDFTIEFKEPVSFNELKIVNGNNASKELFKKNTRIRDIEIILYTIPSSEKKDKKINQKKKKTVPKKSSNKKSSTSFLNNKNSVYDYEYEIFFVSGDETKNGGSNKFEHDEDNIIDIQNSKSTEAENKNADLIKERIKAEQNKKSENSVDQHETDIKKDLADYSKKNKKSGKPEKRKSARSENKTKKDTIAKSNKNTENKRSTKPKIISAKSKLIDKKNTAVNSEKKSPDKQVSKTKESDNNKLKLKVKNENLQDNKIINDTAAKNNELNKSIPEKINKIYVKKMNGIITPENDPENRVYIYKTLADTSKTQSLKLKKSYLVTKVSFRLRDDMFYYGEERDRPSISEISFYQEGKLLTFSGINELQNLYIDKFSRILHDSISGKTFIHYENNIISLRINFKQNGDIEFNDRFKCKRAGYTDCTGTTMPDKWKISEGKLLMRYHTLWRTWKYELDSRDAMTVGDDKIYASPQWMKLYTINGDSPISFYIISDNIFTD